MHQPKVHMWKEWQGVAAEASNSPVWEYNTMETRTMQVKMALEEDSKELDHGNVF